MPPPPAPNADVNEDGQVNFYDVFMVLGAWGECPGCREDIDASGFVDLTDLLIVINQWGG